LTATDALLQKTPVHVDAAVNELFRPLVGGARLVMARPGGHRDPADLVDTIRREHITVAGFAPAMLNAFIEHPATSMCSSLTTIVCGGEALPAHVVARCHEVLPNARVQNQYGPTEATLCTTLFDCISSDRDPTP